MGSRPTVIPRRRETLRRGRSRQLSLGTLRSDFRSRRCRALSLADLRNGRHLAHTLEVLRHMNDAGHPAMLIA